MIYHKLPAIQNRNKLVYVGLALILFILVAGIAYGSLKYKKVDRVSTPDGKEVLLKVGKESIYYQDLSTELASYPDSGSDTARGILTQKLITDSVILQGGADDGIITLDPSFFNQVDKDYNKRISMVNEVKANLNTDAVNSRGYVVSIWFRNNGYIGPLGLSKSKELARQKLNALHSEVASGVLSIQKAGDIIKNDSSLKQLDIAYKNNALFPFTYYAGDLRRLTLSEDLDEELANLPKAGVSNVYVGTAKDPKTEESYEALYLFGQVTEKADSTKPYKSFDDWLNDKKSIYDVGR
jgi:hypothetical protein